METVINAIKFICSFIHFSFHINTCTLPKSPWAGMYRLLEMSLRALGVTRCLVYCTYLPIIPVSLFYILCDCFVYTIIGKITRQGQNIPDVKLLLNGSLFRAPKMKLYLDQKRRDNILLPWASTAICTRYLSYTEATEKPH